MLTFAYELSSYLPIALLIVMAVIFVVVNLVGTHLLGPRRHGEEKDIAYESGMNPIGTARKRFNVRFYILAMTFLVFDVEIIFLYPWAVIYREMLKENPNLIFGSMVSFLGILFIGYIYALKKGAFDWKS